MFFNDHPVPNHQDNGLFDVADRTENEDNRNKKKFKNHFNNEYHHLNQRSTSFFNHLNQDLNQDKVPNCRFSQFDRLMKTSKEMDWSSTLNKDYTSPMIYQSSSGYLNDKNNNLVDKSLSDPRSNQSSRFSVENLTHLSKSPSSTSPNPDKKEKLFGFYAFPQDFIDYKLPVTYLTNEKQTDLFEQKIKNQQRHEIWHERPNIPNIQNIPDIHTLHPELWAIIFTNLTIKDKGRVARTCRFFRDIVYSKSVWKGEIVKLHLERRYSVVLESLAIRGIKSIQVRTKFFLFFLDNF